MAARNGRLDEVRRVLADGEWHPAWEIVEVVGLRVPFGQAYRSGVSDYVDPVAVGEERVAAAGARAIVVGLLSKSVKRGALEQRGHKGAMEYRINRSYEPPRRQECTVDGCSIGARSRGLCNGHYQRWKVAGDGFDRSPIRPPAGSVAGDG